MPRHGPETVCCARGLHRYLPSTGDEERRRRLAEAAATGAKTLVTVCHGCQELLDSPGTNPAIRVVNYIQLVGEALGLRQSSKDSGKFHRRVNKKQGE